MKSRFAALAALLLAAVPLALATAPPTHAAETCQGEPATVVGTPGGFVRGTDGRDVIVSNRGAFVSALDGDDLVCITGDRSAQVEVRAGLGDDEVHVLGRTPVRAMLDSGEDTFVGGPLGDFVFGGFSDTGGQDYDEEYDHIETGGGYDGVAVGECDPEFTLADDVDLGTGGGSLTIMGGATAPEAVLDGGPDGLGRLRTVCHGPGPWAVDNTDPEAGVAVGPGGATYTWRHFDDFELGFKELTFRGSDRPERLFTVGTVKADLGGGDDVMLEHDSTPFPLGLDGGEGRDLVIFASLHGSGVTVDVGAGHAVWSGGNTVPITGFERHGAEGSYATLLGGAGPDDLFGTSCRLTIRGGAGSDVLRAYDPLESGLCPGTTQRVLVGGDHGDRIIGDRQSQRIFGGTGSDTVFAGPGADRVQGDGGNDVTNGGIGNDALYGGAGRDTAEGALGTDRCRAERTLRCER